MSSLLLALRAHLFCEQQKWTECQILAEDSSRLDPAAPYGLSLHARALTMQNDHTAARALRQRAEKLGMILFDRIYMYRGRSAFYAARDLASDDLSHVITHPVYASEAMLLLGRISLDQKQYAKAHDRLSRNAQLQTAQ